MTSVGVILSAVWRIKSLKGLLKEPQSFPNEAEGLLERLETVKELLVAAYEQNKEAEAGFVEFEKQVVRLSYEIVDAIADASFKPVSLLRQWKKPGNSKLEELQGRLDGFQGKLDPGSVIQGVEKERGKKSFFSGAKLSFPWQKGGNRKVVMGEGVEKMSEPASPVSPNPVQQDPVEQEELLNRVREELLNPSSSSEVCLVGESGMGKAALARKLFRDGKIGEFFQVVAWIPISHNFNIKGVLQLLMQQLSPQLDTRVMNEIELIALIFAHLKSKKYLIVLEDIDSLDDWESLRLALPIASSARVLITTSSQEFGQGPNRYLISGLTKPDILRLLKKEASFKSGWEKVGEAIYEVSGGSPLYAMILGNSVEAEVAAGGEQRLLQELYSYLPHKGTTHVLEASYKRLAPELKTCLLYMGLFPPRQDISVGNLYLLLVAENLIPPDESEVSLQYLKAFLDRLGRLRLVQVKEDKVATRMLFYESCRLHERVRDFCRTKGLDEEFIQVVELPSSAKVGLHTRRLAVYLSSDSNSIQFDNPDTAKKILSLFIFDTFESESSLEANYLIQFSHLRILKFQGVNFKARKILKGMEKLVLLRYLSFRGCLLEEIPSSLGNLTHLETLDLLVRYDCNVIIPNAIFTNMNRMVHLYLPRQYQTSDGNTKVRLQGMEKLEVLVNFDTEIFDVEALDHFKNLKILSTISKAHSKELAAVIGFIKGGEQELRHSSVVIKSFNCYNTGSASELKELMQCKLLHSIHIEGRVGELPSEEDGDSSSFEEIVLEGSELQVDPMGYLGKFKNLRSLVLSNDAFLGDEILISAVMFPNLRSLKLQNLHFLKKITIEKKAMPKLSALRIESCGCLVELSIPKQVDTRLKKVQRERGGGDAYSVTPSPPKFIIT